MKKLMKYLWGKEDPTIPPRERLLKALGRFLFSILGSYVLVVFAVVVTFIPATLVLSQQRPPDESFFQSWLFAMKIFGGVMTVLLFVICLCLEISSYLKDKKNNGLLY